MNVAVRLPIAALCLVGLLTIACGSEFHLPKGVPEEGKNAFRELGCHVCHRVEGGDFPDPVADPPVPVVLGKGPRWLNLSRLDIAEAILDPSHTIVRYRRHVRTGELSRMGSYESMTLEQWVNLVAYLDTLRE